MPHQGTRKEGRPGAGRTRARKGKEAGPGNTNLWGIQQPVEWTRDGMKQETGTTEKRRATQEVKRRRLQAEGLHAGGQQTERTQEVGPGDDRTRQKKLETDKTGQGEKRPKMQARKDESWPNPNQEMTSPLTFHALI